MTTKKTKKKLPTKLISKTVKLSQNPTQQNAKTSKTTWNSWTPFPYQPLPHPEGASEIDPVPIDLPMALILTMALKTDSEEGRIVIRKGRSVLFQANTVMSALEVLVGVMKIVKMRRKLKKSIIRKSLRKPMRKRRKG